MCTFEVPAQLHFTFKTLFKLVQKLLILCIFKNKLFDNANHKIPIAVAKVHT